MHFFPAAGENDVLLIPLICSQALPMQCALVEQAELIE